jgi:CheY-like chemotaxis protein
MRVLIPDDNERTAAIIAAELTAHGFTVVAQVATTGYMLEIIDATKPDLVSLDIEMTVSPVSRPVRDGLTIAEAIRARAQRVGIFIPTNHTEQAPHMMPQHSIQPGRRIDREPERRKPCHHHAASHPPPTL